MKKEQGIKKDGKQVKRKRTQWVKELEQCKQYTHRKGKYQKEGWSQKERKQTERIGLRKGFSCAISPVLKSL